MSRRPKRGDEAAATSALAAFQEENAAQSVLSLLGSLLVPIVRAAVRAELDSHAPEREQRQPTLERLTLRETAKALRCHERSARKLIATGRLRATRLASGGSSRILVARSEIDRFLRELEAQ